MKGILICVFIVGLCIGLFLNICINGVGKEKTLINKDKYFVLGFINAISYLALYWVYGLNFYMAKYCIFFSILLLIAVIDAKTKSVYLKFSILAIVLALILDLYQYIILKEEIQVYIWGAILAFIIFFVIVKVTKAMGEGDIEVAVICGLFLGERFTLLTILLSFILGGVLGVTLVLLKKKGGKDEIAFIPYLLLGSYIAVFAGDFLIDWYLNCY